MRTPTLQYLYLQKPVTLIVVICILSVLPWIGLGDFSTKGEPREASVAISMLTSDNWVLPQAYANEFAYKPPMAHWLMTICSYPQGYVSEFTSRLPSALAFIVLIGFVLLFFGKRIVKFQEAFIATLLLVTCVEIHRAAMTTRVDMLLTTFIVLGLFQLYRWEEKLELKGLPIVVPLLLGCAILTKGPVGVVLPLLIFGVYLLMLGQYSYLTIFKTLLYAGISSIFLPMLWYIAAWKQGGDEFLNLVLAENFARFLHLQTPAISYDLGHENGVWYNFMTLAAGFMPWTIFFVFSLFGLKLSNPRQSVKQSLGTLWKRIRGMEKVRLFSLVSLVVILFFYSIPSSKRSVYLMPAYPFIALFLAQYALYITEYRTKVTRIFAAVLASVVSVCLIGTVLTIIGAVNPMQIASQYTSQTSVIEMVQMVSNELSHLNARIISILIFNIIALGALYYQMFKKINIKILYTTIALTFAVNMLIDGVIMHSIRKGNSCRPFAEEIRKAYPLDKTNTYVMNNLHVYRNLYGLNFYMGNCFQNFETAAPEKGFLLVGEKDMAKVQENYGDRYVFKTLIVSDHAFSELSQKIVLSEFLLK